MGEQATATLVIILLIIALGGGLVYLPRFFLRRAVRQVVTLLRDRGVTSPSAAATLEEMGLGPKTMFERMFRMRDYKPYAVRLLTQAEVLKVTEEGRVYLSEESLAGSPLKNFAHL